jgi:hypothetical protein
MKIVISWSGPRSKMAAEAIKGALAVAIQASDPWMSSDDIAPGAYWGEEIRAALDAASVGILCVTAENKDRPWILFEAGALAKGMATEKRYACVVLIGLAANELPGPLGLLQAVTADRQGFEKLFSFINDLCEKPVKPEAHKTAFGYAWPALENTLEEAMQLLPEAGAKKRTESDKLDEILGIVREVRQDAKRQSFGPGLVFQPGPVGGYSGVVPIGGYSGPLVVGGRPIVPGDFGPGSFSMGAVFDEMKKADPQATSKPDTQPSPKPQKA